MRIIAGELRGRRLVSPAGRDVTRPITDKVKETLFNKLYSAGILPGEQGARVADVFCGTGSLGLEAISRGAAHCLFVELSRQALRGLTENLENLEVTDRAQVVEADAMAGTWLTALSPDSLRVCFLDPPYAMMRQQKTRDGLTSLVSRLHDKLEPGGVAVLRAPADEQASPAEVPPLDGPLPLRFKHMALYFYQRAPE
jgi:16S rRNA (guanine966-N2)-methyltransferase